MRPAALSNPSWEATPDELMNHPLGIRPSPQPDFACGGCGTRLSNKINAAGSTNPVIWTALAESSPGRESWVRLEPGTVPQGRLRRSQDSSPG